MIWYVAAGGAAGSVVRFLLSGLVQQRLGAGFPYGTFVINITGSFLLGFLLRYALGSTTFSPNTRALLTTGFCGGYTTFSTYTYETATLVLDGQYGKAGAYAAFSVVLALIGVFGGFALARQVLTLREHLGG